MNVDAISRLFVTYLVNAVWQVPVITIVVVLCARLMRRAPSEYKHRLWVAALLLVTLLPLLSLGSASGGSCTALVATEWSQSDTPSSNSNGSTHIFYWFGGRPHRQPLFFTPL